MADLQSMFEQLKTLLQKYEKKPGLVGRDTTIDPKTKIVKPAYHIYGKKEVSLMGRKPQQTYVVGIILQKHFVVFYSMPLY